jgi:hypothetical protein
MAAQEGAAKHGRGRVVAGGVKEIEREASEQWLRVRSIGVWRHIVNLKSVVSLHRSEGVLWEEMAFWMDPTCSYSLQVHKAMDAPVLHPVFLFFSSLPVLFVSFLTWCLLALPRELLYATGAFGGGLGHYAWPFTHP